MNITDFLLLHTTGLINLSGRINVLYNPVPNTDDGKIEAITVSMNASSVTPEPVSGVDLNLVLQQVETITLEFGGLSYQFTIVSRDFVELAPNPFFFFQVESDNLIPNINLAYLENPENDVTVILEPFLNNGLFLSSDYNVLFNNGNALRLSTKRMESDREAGLLKPTNFQALLTLSASRAAVQDSFYTDTGLTNARYVGSKTTAEEYSGVAAFLTGNRFSGEIFPPGVNTDFACGIGSANRVLEEMFHSGEFGFPTFTTQSIGAITDTPGAQLQTTDISISYTPNDINLATQPLVFNPGDILVFNSATSTEKMKVLSHNPDTQRVEISRGHLGTTPQVIPDNEPIFRIARTDLFQEDQFNRTLTTIGESVVFVLETNLLLNLDSSGTVFSSSICPAPVLLGIDNPEDAS